MVASSPDQAPANSPGRGIASPGLICYALNESPQPMRAATTDRSWMNAFADRHPYRCLPLTIANAYGWELLCPVAVEVEWNGGGDLDDLCVRASDSTNALIDRFCVSNFSRGVVTFHVDYIFETSPGWGLLVTGPANWPRANAVPLTGIVESDWLPYTFTMNYQMLHPGIERWCAGDPYCVVVPVPRLALSDTVPAIRRLTDNVDLSARHHEFRRARDDFRSRLRSGDQEAVRQAWQRFYFLGRNVDGTPAPEHISKLRLHQPVDERSPRCGSARGVGTTEPGVRNPIDEAGRGRNDSLEGRTAARAATDDAPERRWSSRSLLNGIHDGQTPLNVAGRGRVDSHGVLRRSPDTREIASAADAKGLDVLCVDKLIPQDECRRMVDAFNALRHLVVQDDPIDPFWSERYLWGRDIARARPEVVASMIDAARRATELLKEFYEIDAPLYADLLQLVHWQTGMAMPPHADRLNPDGSAHRMSYRDFGGVLYLNDGYNGGELYFTKLDLVVKPKTGMFVAFTGGFHHEHTVLRIESAPLRLTMPMFFTFDAGRADELIHPRPTMPAHGTGQSGNRATVP